MRRAIFMTALLVAAGMAVSATGAGPEKTAKSKPPAVVKTPAASTRPAPASSKEPMIRVSKGTGSASAPAASDHPLSPEAQQALLVVTTYLDQLKQGEPYDAVDQQFDTDVLLHSVFGEELKDTSPGELRYLSDLTRSLIKAAVTILPMHEVLKTAQLSDPEVVQAGDSQAIVKITRGDAKPGQPTDYNFLVLKGSNGWKIVDLPPMGEKWRAEYAKAKADGMTPCDYLEGVLVMIMSKKLDVRQTAWQNDLHQHTADARRKVEETSAANLREIEEASKKDQK